MDLTRLTPTTMPVVPVDPGLTADEIAALTKAAKTKLDAIDGIIATAGLGGRGALAVGEEPIADGENGSYTLSVERDRMATTVTRHREWSHTRPDAEKFKQAMDLGGGLTMHTRDVGMGVQEIAMVMTDVAEPKAMAFGMVHTLNVDANGGAVDADAVAIKASDGEGGEATFLDNMMSSAFFAAAEESSIVTHTFLEADIDVDVDLELEGLQPRKAAMAWLAYYDGAMGTYTCIWDRKLHSRRQ